jgi:Tfp pilus assembly protein PilN
MASVILLTATLAVCMASCTGDHQGYSQQLLEKLEVNQDQLLRRIEQLFIRVESIATEQQTLKEQVESIATIQQQQQSKLTELSTLLPRKVQIMYLLEYDCIHNVRGLLKGERKIIHGKIYLFRY